MPYFKPSWRPGLILLGVCLGSRAHDVDAAGPAAKWIGQDGKDLVGGEPGPAPNGYQDVHIAFVGLPAGRNLAEVALTGQGHGLWNNQVTNKYVVKVVSGPRPGTFDLYLEPYQRETGRDFELKWKLDNGQSGNVYFAGGKADPNLRVPGLGIEAKWVNPGDPAKPMPDRTGPDVGVGPDGMEDAHVVVAKLNPKAEVKEVHIIAAGSGAASWRSGVNATGDRSAEFQRHATDRTRGDFFFGPASDLTAQKPLKLTVTYADDRTDSTTLTVGKLPSTRALPGPRLMNLPESAAHARWVGQRPAGGTQPNHGAVRVEVDGIVAGRAIVAAALSDGVVSTWVYRRDDGVKFDAGPDPHRLLLNRVSPGKVELEFLPTRDETDTVLTLRLLDPAGHEEVLRFPGGPVDFARLAPPLPVGTIQARPGQDLQVLVDRAGTVQLAPGIYPLNRPLVLSRPIRIVGAGATLKFAQADGKPWTAAIKIHTGGTTLEGFAVRFAGPVRWDREVEHGPAVVAATDNRDGRTEGDGRHSVALLGLDLEGPPAASDWEEATQLIRFRNVGSGQIERCRLKGGTVHLGGGPWSVTDNEYLGTLPHTYSHGAFAVLWGHDVVVARNRAHDVGPSGKTWRFLFLAQRGAHDRIIANVVDGGIGPRQDDPHPHHNSPEVILTEAYRLHYEGKPAAISPDGRILAIYHPVGGPASTGDAVAILAGPQAGQWRTIAQPLGPQLYLLDEPIAADTTVVSLATGFVRETFADNTVDCRGSAIAANLVLAGNVFGVQVTGNQLYGGAETIRLHASPTEAPVTWGWSHAPFLGGTIANNLVEDSLGIGSTGLGVEHGPAIQANKGRTYMSLDFKDNTFRWTDAGLSQRAAIAPSGSRSPRVAIGYAPSLDPSELIVTESGTRVEGAASDAVWINSARINGKSIRDEPLSVRH